MYQLLRRPSAWIPILIPLLFFAYILICLAFFEIVREKDEGVGGHLFQIWLALEPFMLGFFAIKWLSRMPRQTLIILAIQIAVAILPISVVFLLKL